MLGLFCLVADFGGPTLGPFRGSSGFGGSYDGLGLGFVFGALGAAAFAFGKRCGQVGGRHRGSGENRGAGLGFLWWKEELIACR